MKRILSVILALTMALSTAVFVSAAEEIEIPLTAEQITGHPDYFAQADALTIDENGITADQVEIFALALPQNVMVGETVSVHIKGTSVGDFRTWLIGQEVAFTKEDHETFSEMWKASENGFTTGEFDYTLELTATDVDGTGIRDQSNKICFKAPVSHGILEGFNLQYVGITYEGVKSADSVEEIEIPLVPESLTGRTDYFATADQLTFGDGSLTADGVQIFAFALPQNVPLGETVTVHIKGHSVGDFRTWLIAAEETDSKGDHATFSEMWKATDNGFKLDSDFEYEISMTAADMEPINGTQANKLCFKAPASGGTLDGFTLTYVGIKYGEADLSISDEEMASLEESLQKMNDLLAGVQADPENESVVTSAITDAQTVLSEMEVSESVSLGRKEAMDIYNDAKRVYNEIENLSKGLDQVVVMQDIQSYVETANAALETAKAAGSDVDAVTTALADASAALEYVRDKGNSTGYTDVLAKARELKAVVEEIEGILEESRALKAQEDAEAEAKAAEEAERAAKTRSIVIIVVIVAVVAIVIVAIAVTVVKKKKK